MSNLDFRGAPQGRFPAAAATSYFSSPEDFLDPRLFRDHVMHDEVRAELAEKFRRHVQDRFHGAESWAKVWLAGSGASYQWAANREPGDLDMLIGVDYPQFRYHNQQYGQLTDAEVSSMLTEGFRAHLNGPWSPPTDPTSSFDATWYCNPGSTDIRAIKPYAAYDILNGRWDVEPDPRPRPLHSPQGDRDQRMAVDILKRYESARTALQGAPVNRQRHEETLTASAQQASALYHEIHEGRRAAFGPLGKGYADPANARWQSAKASGIVPALKALADFVEDTEAAHEIRQYGVRLPSVDDLLLRALLVTDER